MASKNIVAKGTTYNGVESVTFPVSGGGNATFYEISDTTAVAADVDSSKWFYTALGVLTQGTASGGGGGGGLVYETGTWAPTEDANVTWIYFSDTHTTLPLFVALADASDTFQDQTYSSLYLCIDLFSEISGARIYYNATSGLYGRVTRVRRDSGATGIANDVVSITQPLTSPDSSSQSYPKYWVTEQAFRTSNVTTFPWRANRTYKWIAVWAPTT